MANNYKIGLGLIKSKLLWDFKLESFRSRKAINRIKNKYLGQKAVIVCNGPSLNKVDLSKLKNIYTFGLNKIYLKFDENDFKTNCIISVNDDVLEQCEEIFKKLNIDIFFKSKAYKIYGRKENFRYIHTTGFPSFSEDCSESVYIGGTVTYVALQLAFHMGFKYVGLIGCDHSFKGYTGYTTERKLFEGPDINHFDPNYFKDQVWGLPNIPKSEFVYSMAKENYEKNNRIIYNCTEGGKLEVFERLDLDEFLKL